MTRELSEKGDFFFPRHSGVVSHTHFHFFFFNIYLFLIDDWFTTLFDLSCINMN